MDQQNISEMEGKYGQIIVVHAKKQGNKEEIEGLFRVLVEELLRQAPGDAASLNTKTE